MMKIFCALIGLSILLFGAPGAAHSATTARLVTLTRAVVEVDPGAGPVERKAAQMLVEETAKRTGVTLSIVEHAAVGASVIRLSAAGETSALKGAESYSLKVARKGGAGLVTARGADPAGCMFAVGYLLREMRLSPGKIEAPEMDVVRAPVSKVRGHQLGWRRGSNTYMSWGVREYEQYIRDLIIWGTNAVELIPNDSATDPVRSEEMTLKVSELAHSYGLQVWLWYPFDEEAPKECTAEGKKPGQACPSLPAGRRFLLQHREHLFSSMKYLDAVFIPGGDPGGCECKLCSPWEHTFVPLCTETARILRATHPEAQLWLSNQAFSKEENADFFGFIGRERPTWLAGLIYSPWAVGSCEAMKKLLPSGFQLGLYPDIGHEVRCQFTEPNLDQALASTIEREPPLYRLHETEHLVRFLQPSICGSISYSDGVNDDIHKALWSAYLWDPNEDLTTVVRDYARFFYGSEVADRASEGLFDFEKNMRVPLRDNADVEKTAALWNALDRDASPALRGNWRYQMALLRANYDLYVQRKLRADLATDSAVYEALRPRTRQSVDAALAVLKETEGRQVEPELRQKLIDLGQALRDSIGIKLSAARWGAARGRATIIDNLDVPLGNRDWLNAELTKLGMRSDDAAYAAGIDRIVNWENPGAGGYYDDLGDPNRQPHLVRLKTFADDPGGLESPRCEFAGGKGYRQTWSHYAETLYGTPIQMRYTGLDPAAQYVLRATYSGRYKPVMTLTANENVPVHGPVAATTPPSTLEWPVPREATSGGTLTLTWNLVKGRGCQVSEVWLLKRAPDAAR